ncbi:MAG TPA: phage holin family protein [Solirubrobacteraceae bacterium]
MPADTRQDENLGQVVTDVTERVSVLVREEIELAKAEVTTKVTSIARGAIAVAIGAVLGVFALIYGLLAVAWAINDATGDLWPGFVIVFAILFAMALGAFLFAWRKLKVGAPTPQMAIDEAKLIRETVKTEVDR